jgi:hypothetical protein
MAERSVTLLISVSRVRQAGHFEQVEMQVESAVQRGGELAP